MRSNVIVVYTRCADHGKLVLYELIVVLAKARGGVCWGRRLWGFKLVSLCFILSIHFYDWLRYCRLELLDLYLFFSARALCERVLV